MKYNEIPINVLKKVYKKWNRIYKKGKWEDDYWDGCTMCNYLHKRYNCTIGVCSKCPLYKSSWCNGRGDTSRLAIYSHFNDEDTTTEMWLKDVKKFVGIMERMLAKRMKVK